MKTVVQSVAQRTGTRERVRALLLTLGPSTVAALSERLGVSPAGVRKHLDALLAAGTVTTREPRSHGLRGRGRPARRYLLTEAGHACGPAGYDDLAVSALRFLAAAGGQAAVERFAQEWVAELEDRYAVRLHRTSASDRPAVLAEVLSAEGYAATTSEQGFGVQLCQHHSPVQHVAAEFPQLCDAETAAIGRLLDVHVQRLATISHDDGGCTTFIPTPTGKASR